MTQLKPCPACQRHIRTHETSCPFCSALVPDGFAAPLRRALPEKRLGRAATFALGVALSQSAACGDSDSQAGQSMSDAGPRDASMQDSGTQHETPPNDGGESDADLHVVPIYAAALVPLDAGPAAHDSGQENDAGVDAGDAGTEGGFIPIYAAAPTPDDGTRLADGRSNDTPRNS